MECVVYLTYAIPMDGITHASMLAKIKGKLPTMSLMYNIFYKTTGIMRILPIPRAIAILKPVIKSTLYVT